MDLNELDEGPLSDFRGATLQIVSDPMSPLNENLGPSSRLNRRQSNSDASAISQTNSEEIILSPAVLSSENLTQVPSDERTRRPRPTVTDVATHWTLLPVDEAKDFFTHRDGLVQAAIAECVRDLVAVEQDGDLLGSWLLTEITSWDNEKERLVILTSRMLTIVKYDFIALKQLEFRKIPLALIDTVVIGPLEYPTGSLVPRLEGLAEGMSSSLQALLTNSKVAEEPATPRFRLDSFEPRPRRTPGMRVMWNRGEPLSFTRKWNPFNSEIPFVTFTSHPLFLHREPGDPTDSSNNSRLHNLEDLSERLQAAVGQLPARVLRHPVVLQSYLGLGAMLHNRNALGFFKVRGRYSF